MDFRLTDSGWIVVCVRKLKTEPGFENLWIRQIKSSIDGYRRDSQAVVGSWFRKEGETAAQGWRRAYRKGYRCVRTSIVTDFTWPPAGKANT